MTTIMNTVQDKIYGASVSNKLYGEGVVLNIEITEAYRVFITVAFLKKTTKLDAEIAMPNGFLNFADPTLATEVYNTIELLKNKKAADDISKHVAKLEDLKKKQEEANKKKAEDTAKKDAERFERAKKAAIEKFESMKNETYNFSGSHEEYYQILGWLAANVRTISARLPDYLDNAFGSHFGADAPRTLVNTNRRTVGGFKPQWSYAFSASIKNKECAPVKIQSMLNTKGKIADTTFIWNLIDNHNFKFGRAQNLEDIRKSVPTNMLVWFDFGSSIS